MTDNESYMRRALSLARAGMGHVTPNPMVGAVVVAPDGRIIGEGWHRRFGGPHAEVNALASVAPADERLLPYSTMYVTLEPCSHYGKTPPCANLLVEKHIKRVVVATLDPNPLVAGRGMAILADAGIEVSEGMLGHESRRLNAAFFTAHTLHRPYVTLKWAVSCDGYMAVRGHEGSPGPVRLSSAQGRVAVHMLRSHSQAIAVGASTVIADSPALTVRGVAGPSPRPVIFDRRGIVPPGHPLRLRPDTIYLDAGTPAEQLRALFADYGIISLLVEGGPSLLRHFIAEGLWEKAYVERAGTCLGDRGAAPQPPLPVAPSGSTSAGGSTIYRYDNPVALF